METTSEVVAATSEKNKTTPKVEFPGRGGRILEREGGSANLKDSLWEKGELLPHWFPTKKTEAGRTRGAGCLVSLSVICLIVVEEKWKIICVSRNKSLFSPCQSLRVYSS